MPRKLPGGKLAAALLGLGAVLVSGPAAALPNYEINWEYYSDGTYTEIVGGRTISCSGNGGRWGLQTEYAVFTQGEKCERDPPFPGWNDPPGEWRN